MGCGNSMQQAPRPRPPPQTWHSIQPHIMGVMQDFLWRSELAPSKGAHCAMKEFLHHPCWISEDVADIPGIQAILPFALQPNHKGYHSEYVKFFKAVRAKLVPYGIEHKHATLEGMLDTLWRSSGIVSLARAVELVAYGVTSPKVMHCVRYLTQNVLFPDTSRDALMCVYHAINFTYDTRKAFLKAPASSVLGELRTAVEKVIGEKPPNLGNDYEEWLLKATTEMFVTI